MARDPGCPRCLTAPRALFAAFLGAASLPTVHPVRLRLRPDRGGPGRGPGLRGRARPAAARPGVLPAGARLRAARTGRRPPRVLGAAGPGPRRCSPGRRCRRRRPALLDRRLVGRCRLGLQGRPGPRGRPPPGGGPGPAGPRPRRGVRAGRPPRLSHRLRGGPALARRRGPRPGALRARRGALRGPPGRAVPGPGRGGVPAGPGAPG